MAELQRISPDWADYPCIVAAPGPSLTPEVVHKCRMKRWIDKWWIIAVQDSYRLMPFADALYGCDDRWWNLHQDCKGFEGEKWSTHEKEGNDKIEIADKYGINLVVGEHGSEFSTDPGVIRYGANSGFQAINLAILKGCKKIVLVGFDMRRVDNKAHFFGEHPPILKAGRGQDDYAQFLPVFNRAAKVMPKGVTIINATPDSALTCFKKMPLDVALQDDSLYRDRPEPHAAAG